MKTLAALLLALPIAAAAQAVPQAGAPPAAVEAAPPAAAPAAPLAQPAPPPATAPAAPPPAHAQPAPAPVYQPGQAAPPGYPPGYVPPPAYPPGYVPPPAYPPGYGPPPGYPPGYLPPPRRDTWYIGFGLGSGGGNFTTDAGTQRLGAGLESPTTIFLNFKVGVTLAPTLLLGLDFAGHATSGTETVFTTRYDVTRQITNVDAMLTWFPVERGFFLRGGLGISNLREELASTYATDLDGANLTVGAGYAFWLGRTFNLTVNLDFSAQAYDSNQAGAPTKTNFTAIWLGFDWY